MTPDSLGVWIQRAGRAGRQSETVAKAYLLVQPSVFQEVKRRNTGGEETMEYKKVVEDALREWVETDSCQRDVIDKWYNNPDPREGERDIKKKYDVTDLVFSTD
jgi:superfamily II DNA helicase RecQ